MTLMSDKTSPKSESSEDVSKNEVSKTKSSMHNHVQNFGVWLRKHRTEQQLSLEDLATRTGVSKQYISVLERAAPQGPNGKIAIPSRDVVEALAEALGEAPEIAREVAGYSADAETYALIEGVELAFKGACQLTANQRQRLIDACLLIAAGVAAEDLAEWINRIPQLGLGRGS